MFIERSTARIRLTRTLFLLVGVLPCAGLCGWAAARQSSWHRRGVERGVERAIGLPCRIGGVEHLRPQAVRWRDVELFSASGGLLLSVPTIEVESSPRELRLFIGGLECSPELAEGLSRLAREWLEQPARYPLDCVVDVGDFAWGPAFRPAEEAAAGDRPGRRPAPAGRLRVECVAAHESRAIRVRLDAAGRDAPDEVRLVARRPRDPVDPAPADGTPPGGPVVQVRGEVNGPLPIAILERLAGFAAGTFDCGAEAAVRGFLEAECDAGTWSGRGRCRVERLDLATVSRHLPHRLSGEAALDVERLDWSRGRVTSGDCRLDVTRGRVGQAFLDGLVATCGCRPGAAYRSLSRDELRSFDDATMAIRLGAGGLEVRAGAGRDASLARVGGMSILDEPHALVPLERLAWLLSPPGAVAVPASKPAFWLLGWFDLSAPPLAGGPPATGRAEPPRAVRDGQGPREGASGFDRVLTQSGRLPDRPP